MSTQQALAERLHWAQRRARDHRADADAVRAEPFVNHLQWARRCAALRHHAAEAATFDRLAVRYARQLTQETANDHALHG